MYHEDIKGANPCMLCVAHEAEMNAALGKYKLLGVVAI